MTIQSAPLSRERRTERMYNALSASFAVAATLISLLFAYFVLWAWPQMVATATTLAKVMATVLVFLPIAGIISVRITSSELRLLLWAGIILAQLSIVLF